MTKRFVFIFLWLGSLSLLFGSGLAFIDLRFKPLYIFLSIVGMVFLLIAAGGTRERVGRISWLVYFKRGLSVFIYCSMLIAALALINYLALRYNFHRDVTQNKQHTLTDNTLKLIKALKRGVRLTAFYVGLPPKYLEDLLKEYERGSNGKIKSEIIDPMVDLGTAARFGHVISAKESKLIAQSGGERKDVDFSGEPLNEEAVDNAVMHVTRKACHAYFLAGHGEYSVTGDEAQGLSKLATLLSENNIISDSLLLGTQGKMPQDADLLIAAGPHYLL